MPPSKGITVVDQETNAARRPRTKLRVNVWGAASREMQQRVRILLSILHAHAVESSTKIFMTIAKKAAVDWRAVGRRLRELRGFDLNQAEFARQLGISQSQISRYEKGVSDISAEVLLRISQKSARSIEWLLTGKES